MSEPNVETSVNEVAKAERNTPAEHINLQTDYSLGIFGTSDNFKMAWQMAQALAASTVVPAPFQNNPSNCLIAIEQANRLKMSPFMVMQNLYVIQGKPSWSSKFLIAMINGSGKFDTELQYDETKDKDGKPYSCLAWAMKSGRRIEGMVVDMQMAKDEGWIAKNGSKWKTLPALMLRYRAASFFASLNCPEVSLGIYTQEEIIDNDMREYRSPEEIRATAKADISNNANQTVFEDEPIPASAVEVGEQEVLPFT